MSQRQKSHVPQSKLEDHLERVCGLRRSDSADDNEHADEHARKQSKLEPDAHPRRPIKMVGLEHARLAVMPSRGDDVIVLSGASDAREERETGV